jgi:hypothetical protein
MSLLFTLVLGEKSRHNRNKYKSSVFCQVPGLELRGYATRRSSPGRKHRPAAVSSTATHLLATGASKIDLVPLADCKDVTS